ncbi:hypothetical protein U27_05959 [Candidatus Vecturithrix granuli]|uniref:Uncharacterized protein n=1 Tax=Vecturithrix granuli TaxID=1499967 RepID=A0A081C329_VECG1|nr:hypothetical protein U27_05959 [Candidatus Vecturithrix granuli]
MGLKSFRKSQTYKSNKINELIFYISNNGLFLHNEPFLTLLPILKRFNAQLLL